MMQVAHGMDGTKRKKPGHAFKKRGELFRQSVGEDLEVVEADKVTPTNAQENKHRRTICVRRAQGQAWGFTLQSYGIHHRKAEEVELLTYIDYVAHNSPAFMAGMRCGDVILSINGTNMEDSDHQELINFIQNCINDMRMVVLFEDCCRKVELHHRYLKLKRVLAEKIFEVRSLEHQEMRLISGLSRFDSCRSSRASSASSSSFFDDRRSLLMELDRCPTPRIENRTRPGLNPALCSLELYSSSRSLSPLPAVPTAFDFDRSTLPSRRQRIRSLAVSVSVHAAWNASTKKMLNINGLEATGGRSLEASRDKSHSSSSPALNRQSPLSFNSSAIFEHSDGETSPQQQCRSKRTRGYYPSSSAVLDYRLPPPHRELHRSGRHASAPDKLNPVRSHHPEALELRLLKLHVSGVNTRESSPTEILEEEDVDGYYNNNEENDADEEEEEDPITGELNHSLVRSPPKSSSFPQLSVEYRADQYRGKRQLGVNRQSASSLNSSGSSIRCHVMDTSVDSGSVRCGSPVSDPGTPPASGTASFSDSNFSYSDLPVIELELINSDDAVSHL